MIKPAAKETIRMKIRVPREEIVFIDMIFKASKGIALITVDDLKDGTLYIDMTEGTKPDVMGILEDLQQRFPLEIL
ncbi:DUF4911 domain-containing protein [Natronospora cellulosivora (SeqCode)]